MKPVIRSTILALAAGLMAAGCAHGPSPSDQATAEAAIGHAGEAIDRASGDPHVSKYAASELERGSDTLAKAKSAWNDKHDLQTTQHLAYLAQQRAVTAQELASGRASEESFVTAANMRNDAVTRVTAERQAPPQTASVSGQQDLAGFRFGASKVPPKAKPVISELAASLKNDPNAKVVIEGHTDNVGPPAYNQALALSRAQAVRSALVREGVDANRIEVRSLGEENPVASNDTREGRRENRRAQVIIGEGGATAVGSSQGGSTGSSSGEGEQGMHPPDEPPAPPPAQPPVPPPDEKGQNGQDSQQER